MKEILTSKGERILVDDADYESLCQWNWHVSRGYVVTNMPHPLDPTKRLLVRMHRYLMGLGLGDIQQVDHHNGSRLDNQRHNLRVCSNAENSRNRGRKTTNTSGYKGVHFNKECQKWQAYIGIDGKLKHLGLFESAESAYAAYCAAARELHGEFANFGEQQCQV